MIELAPSSDEETRSELSDKLSCSSTRTCSHLRKGVFVRGREFTYLSSDERDKSLLIGKCLLLLMRESSNEDSIIAPQARAYSPND